MKYSKYACHELSFFISRKDPAFFKEVVRPHLANKKDLTFMDDYLLGNLLSKYYQSFEYVRLNVVERILLAQSERKRMVALGLDLENRLALRSPNIDSAKLWFGAAVGGGAGAVYAGGGGAAERKWRTRRRRGILGIKTNTMKIKGSSEIWGGGEQAKLIYFSSKTYSREMKFCCKIRFSLALGVTFSFIIKDKMNHILILYYTLVNKYSKKDLILE